MKCRLVLILNSNQKQKSILIIDSNGCSNPLDEIKKAAKNKLKIKNPSRLFVLLNNSTNTAYELQDESMLKNLLSTNESVELVISKGEDYVGTLVSADSTVAAADCHCQVHIIAKDSFIEEDAVKQIDQTAKKCSYIVLASGMPDLHPGNTYPIGVSFLTRDDVIYPALIGNDIGCGMTLFQLSEVSSSSVDVDKVKKRLVDMEGPYSAWKEFCTTIDPRFTDSRFAEDDEVNRQIGTIGGGNHFAELLAVDCVLNSELLPAGFDDTRAFLLVHSGSRLLGQRILEAFKASNEVSLTVGSDAGNLYLARHDYACNWAKANRRLIAERFHSCLQIPLDSSRTLLDVWHNRVSQKVVDDQSYWVHRKGAAPSDEGYVVIPGSRGAYSYLVLPRNPESHFENGYSLAHGAGRKIQRGKTVKIRDKLRNKASTTVIADLTELLLQTPFQSAVICDDPDLLVEEHQDAYKEIEDIINDLVHFGLIDVVARMRPLVTYKKRNVI